MTLVAHVQLCKAAGEAGDKLRLRSWIEIELLGEDDRPIPDENYAIELPGQKIVTGTLDSKGTARLDGIPAGICKVSFPNLDKDAWTPLQTQSADTTTTSGEAA